MLRSNPSEICHHTQPLQSHISLVPRLPLVPRSQAPPCASFPGSPLCLVPRLPLVPRSQAPPCASFPGSPLCLVPRLPLVPRSQAPPCASFPGSPLCLVPRLPLVPRSQAPPCASFPGSPLCLVPRLPLVPRSQAPPCASFPGSPLCLVPRLPLVQQRKVEPENETKVMYVKRYFQHFLQCVCSTSVRESLGKTRRVDIWRSGFRLAGSCRAETLVATGSTLTHLRCPGMCHSSTRPPNVQVRHCAWQVLPGLQVTNSAVTNTGVRVLGTRLGESPGYEAR